MVRASAYPTIEWLTSTRKNRLTASVESRPRTLASTSTNASVEALYALLSAWKGSDTRIGKHVWIQTPNGEEPVDLVIERKHRRIGVRFSTRYERDTDQTDAVVLVYGRFDTLYRVSPQTATGLVSDLAYALVVMIPSWFTADGRCESGRQASAAALVGSDRLAWIGQLRLPGGSITRIRLSRASDWVTAFENALSTPRLTSFADARHARPRR